MHRVIINHVQSFQFWAKNWVGGIFNKIYSNWGWWFGSHGNPRCIFGNGVERFFWTPTKKESANTVHFGSKNPRLDGSTKNRKEYVALANFQKKFLLWEAAKFKLEWACVRLCKARTHSARHFDTDTMMCFIWWDVFCFLYLFLCLFYHESNTPKPLG